MEEQGAGREPGRTDRLGTSRGKVRQKIDYGENPIRASKEEK